jgi:hypoxanthine phosphoribosyltransferase
MLSENPRDDMKEILFEEEQIQARVAELGAQLGADYKDKTPLMICVLRGAAFFFTDLCRRMDCKMDMDFIAVSSYGHGQASTGAVRLVKDVSIDMTGRHVIIVEDIVESGQTMKRMIESLGTRNPASVHICTLFFKPDKLQEDLTLDYVAFRIPDDFIVGYGLDYDHQGRELKDIYTIVE